MQLWCGGYSVVEHLEVAIFCEDLAHERFLVALVHRLAREEQRTVEVFTMSGRGGHGRGLTEFSAFQKARGRADLLLVCIDANCKRWQAARREIKDKVDSSRFPAYAVACPDPHIERWYLADPQGLKSALSMNVSPGRKKCQRDRYKKLLVDGLKRAGHIVTLGGAEFAEKIVGDMDLYRAGKNEPSLGSFIEDLRSVLRRGS